MAAKNATVTYTGNGSQTVFTFPFDYLKKAFVKAKVAGTELTQGTQFSVTDKQVTFITAPANGATVVIYRDTSSASLVTFIDGSVLRAKDMTTFEIQLLHLTEETDDKVVDDVLAYTQMAEDAAGAAGASAEAAGASAEAAAISANTAANFAQSINPANFAPSGYGLGGDATPFSDDFDNRTVTGFFFNGSSAINGPVPNTQCYLEVIRVNDNYIIQRAAPINTGIWFTRAKMGTWSLWKRQEGRRVGEVFAWPVATVPDDALVCNGQAVSRLAYAPLYAVLGTAYGSGDGSTTFNLPDYRGVFLRGLDAGKGYDTSRTLGSFQDDEFESHAHSNQIYGSNVASGSGGYGYALYQPSSTLAGTNPTGGTETRPKNVSVIWLIQAL